MTAAQTCRLAPRLKVDDVSDLHMYKLTGTRAGAPARPLPQLSEAPGLQLPVLHQGLCQAQPAGETQQNPHRSEVVRCFYSGFICSIRCVRGNHPSVTLIASCQATSLQHRELCPSSTAELHT